MITYFLYRVINIFGSIIIMLICLEAVMSWFVRYFSGGLYRFYNVVRSITEPFVAPFRRITSRFAYSMGIDFSPLIAILVIEVVCKILSVILLKVI